MNDRTMEIQRAFHTYVRLTGCGEEMSTEIMMIAVNSLLASPLLKDERKIVSEEIQRALRHGWLLRTGHRKRLYRVADDLPGWFGAASGDLVEPPEAGALSVVDGLAPSFVLIPEPPHQNDFMAAVLSALIETDLVTVSLQTLRDHLSLAYELPPQTWASSGRTRGAELWQNHLSFTLRRLRRLHIVWRQTSISISIERAELTLATEDRTLGQAAKELHAKYEKLKRIRSELDEKGDGLLAHG